MTPALFRTRLLAVSGILLSSLAPVAAGDEKPSSQIQTRSGARIEAPVLRENEDGLVIDLGFDLLRIPASEVHQRDAISTEPGDEPVAKALGEHLYGERRQHQTDTVANWASRLGEAVVEIRSRSAQGSGFMIHERGYIITNYHVIALDRELSVTVFAGKGQDLDRVQYRNIRIVAMDPVRDLALLKIEDADDHSFPWVPLADSSSVDSGQTVFAVGSPLGLDRTVSRGIVSLADRYMGGRLLLQTTTQINPGNSGGPLLNLFGEVVGVNTLKLMSTGIEGMCFAVPSNQVKLFLQNRSAFAFDPRNPNAGYHYLNPPRKIDPSPSKAETP